MPHNVIVDQASYALFFSFLIQWVKNAKWFPFVNADTATLNKFLAVLASGATALGMHFTFDSATGTLAITGLTFWGIYHGGVLWVRSWLIQEIAYQKLVRQNPSSGGLQVQPAPTAASVQAAKPA